MKVDVVATKRFILALKPLQKKYPSLTKDLLALEEKLQKNPKMGVPLGADAFKIRLGISSKGKGKSGGARVITLVEMIMIGTLNQKDEQVTVNLMTIYDKSATATITDKELKEMIRTFRKGKEK